MYRYVCVRVCVFVCDYFTLSTQLYLCPHQLKYSHLVFYQDLITSPPEGVARYCFHPVCLSVCLCVCLCVCPANILVFYFSAIRRDIDLKFMQDIYRVVLNTQKNIDLHRSKVKVTGTVHCFLKVQSYHKN